MRRLRRFGELIIPFLMLLGALAVKIQAPTAVEPLQLLVFDAYQRLEPRVYQPTPVTIVDIDEESIRRIGQWPWPRTYLADMLYALFSGGVAVVGFDMVFAEADRTSPRQVLPIWPDTPEIEALRGQIDQLPDHDTDFASMIAQTNVVLGFVLTYSANEKQPAQKWGVAEAGDDPRPFLEAFSGAILNLPEIEAASAGNGSFNLIPDRDNIVRRVNMMYRKGQVIYPSLSAEVLRAYQGASTYVLKSSGANLESAFGEETGLNNIKIGRYQIPTDGAGRVWVHYTPTEPRRFLPAWRLFDPAFDASTLEGRIILVGTSAEGLRDIRATPLDPAAPGVEVHAQIIEQVMLKHFVERPDWAEGAELLYLTALGLLLVVLTQRFGAAWSAFSGVTLIATAIAGSWYAFSELRLLLDPIIPSVAVLFIYLAGSLLKYLRTETEKRQVRGAFSQYLSPALVEQVAEQPERLALGGETKEMTFLFCDIRGFTPISEQYKNNPQGLTQLINRFLTPMTDIIMGRSGTIDKYMGDCIMAFWNAPLDDPDHADNACHAALAMVRGLETLNQDLEAEATAEGRPFIPIRVGIGLNSGECVVGNMGSAQRFDYSVLGDSVNLAARLEGQSKNYGVTIIIGDDTRQLINGMATMELDLIAVKGRQEAARIFTLFDDATDAAENEELATAMADMLSAYRGQAWQAARETLAKCRARSPDHGVLWDLYEERIEAYEREPPGADWDGVFVATSK